MFLSDIEPILLRTSVGELFVNENLRDQILPKYVKGTNSLGASPLPRQDITPNGKPSSDTYTFKTTPGMKVEEEQFKVEQSQRHEELLRQRVNVTSPVAPLVFSPAVPVKQEENDFQLQSGQIADLAITPVGKDIVQKVDPVPITERKTDVTSPVHVQGKTAFLVQDVKEEDFGELTIMG